MTSKRAPGRRTGAAAAAKPALAAVPPTDASEVAKTEEPASGLPTSAPPPEPPAVPAVHAIRDTDLEDIRRADAEVARQYEEIGKLSEQIMALEAGRVQLAQQRAKLSDEAKKARDRALRRLGLEKKQVRWDLERGTVSEVG